MLKFLTGLLVATLSLAVAGVAGAAPQSNGPPPATDTIGAAVIRADFEALYRDLRQAHYDLYVHTPQADYDHLYQQTLASFDRPLTLFEIRTRFQRFVAAGHVAHASIAFPGEDFGAYRQGGGTAIPLTVAIDDGHMYIEANQSGVAGLDPGDEIMSLNGTPASDWLTRLGRNISADTDYLNQALVELMFRQLLWLEADSPGRFQLTLSKPDGRRVDVEIPALTLAETRAFADANPGTGTLSLDHSGRIARLMDGGVAYLRPGPFYNATPGEDSFDATTFHAFIDEAFATFIAAGAGDLLIDLRQNPGGYDSFSNAMIAWFADEPFHFASDLRIRVSPQAVAENAARVEAGAGAGDDTSLRLAAAYAGARPGDIIHYDVPLIEPRPTGRYTGRVWVLVDRYSFSNAVNVAAVVQDYGFGRVLGEPTADLATTYGAMEHFTLPRTGITVGFPKAHIIRPNGTLEAAGVTPDILIPTPRIEGSDDPVLIAALKAIADSP
ncbi:S41 family peptidase [uncultured Brevundimonas sp.]|uniref:S41 family peptidase n=1 Tax=uncultured Brevundimonas sp. TaxID=213418 RepID=UPI0030EE802A